jgi:cytochrome c peroxidase
MRSLSCLVLLTTACGPPAPSDAGIDAPSTDVPTDGGCTGEPGVLPGVREVRAGGLLPDLAFATATGEVRLSAFHRPCEPSLLLIRSLAAWSGPSVWHAAHTTPIVALERTQLFDVLVDDVDGMPAGTAALEAFAAGYDVPPDALALDPDDTFARLAFGGVRLPVVLVVDARDLSVMRVLFAPHAGEIEHAAESALATIDGLRPPPPVDPVLVDGRFPPDAWDLIQGMRWAAPPPNPSNRVADDPVAAGLGATFFEDDAMSPASVGCASCHDPGRAFTDALAVGRGVSEVRRNTPTVFGSAHARWSFWDGRVDSLWAQALGPIESAAEMGSSRLYVAHRVALVHVRGYETVFGPLPDLSDAGRFPPAGRPGDPAWDGMTAEDQRTIDTIFVNVGKAIEAFERSLRPPETAFDRYLAGDLEALTPTERDGLLRFVENGCVQCHHGPTLGGSAFFAISMPGRLPPPDEDRGRIAALDALTASPFRRTGAFSDDPAAVDPLAGVAMLPARTLGAFRTPPLRALSSTGPYGHAGSFATLRDVVTHYATIRTLGTTDPLVVGELDPHVPSFDAVEAQVGTITAFLEQL